MIKKLGVILLLLCLGCYFVAAVTVLNPSKDEEMCCGVEVVVEDSLQTGFIRSDEVIQLLKSKKCDPTGCRMGSVSLAQIENVLRKNPFIAEATAYKTPGGKVCVHISQRLPVLHVMASDGSDYYIDRSGKQMPKSSYYADLVVATGAITPQYARKNLLRLGRCIQDNPFWSHQIQQIHVTEDGKVELVPRVGEHIILLGAPTNVEDKLDRMKLFYTEGLNKVGWNKYSTICLEYDNQINCKKNKK